jgi:cyclophilin family peptidyl-prolyl cis-trans isomerase/HEAT repeat protein
MTTRIGVSGTRPATIALVLGLAAPALATARPAGAVPWQPPESPQAAQPAATDDRSSADEPSAAELRRRVLEAEDARSASPAPFLAALESKDNETRRVAVRALGRLERPSLASAIARVLLDPAPAVRAEAANALAQATVAGGDTGLATDLLLDQLGREAHPLVRGALAGAVGRLPHADVAAVRRTERAIVEALKAPPGEGERRSSRDIPAERLHFASPLTLLGGLRGLEWLARTHAKAVPLESDTVKLLEELAVAWRSAVSRSEGGPTAEAAARLRRLATAALVAAGAASPVAISTAFGDPDDQVRRLAAHAAAATEPLDTKLVERAVRDQAAMVRVAIVAALARRGHAATCGYASLVLRDPDPHVATTAIDAAGRACGGQAAAVAAVASIAARIPPPPLADEGRAPETDAGRAPTAFGRSFRGPRVGTWHPAAHALVALARLDPARARERLEAFAKDSRWQLRMYAARAAATCGADALLRTLSEDAHDNVREAAITGLREVQGHAADDVFIGALSRADYQLLIAAAGALEGTARPEEAAEALIAALDRITAARKETSRDTRKALLDRLAETGTPALADRLRPYIADGDPVIARAAADLLTRWTGTTVTPTPTSLPRAALPEPGDLDVLGTARIAMTVRDVGRFEIRLLPSEAPLNAWRFLRLAREGFYEGLTFHRVVPDFVVQGGSPGANEYVGDGPFARDEVGLQSNLRGTLGASTRGRDTADGQFYVNLVDNVRLDHTYTVFAQIERGEDVIDAILEGDVIEDVRVTGGK